MLARRLVANLALARLAAVGIRRRHTGLPPAAADVSPAIAAGR
jgi:hypothetical protein